MGADGEPPAPAEGMPARFAEPEPAPAPESRLALYGRLVVGLVVATVLAVVAIALAVAGGLARDAPPPGLREIFIGPWGVLVSDERPALGVVLVALAAMVAIALVAVLLEVVATLLTVAPRRTLLARRRHLGRDLGLDLTPEPDRLRVTVLVPAHNEEHSLGDTLEALDRQSRRPDRVIVVADNCTDGTVRIARELGHETFETVGNVHRKGGALNQALAWILPTATSNDVVLVMDADTQLSPRFIEVAAARLQADAELAAVGGIFTGEDGHGILGQFQRNEYARYRLQIRQRRGRVFVLTGTATMFRSEALLDVAAARGVLIPGEPGKVYDTAALTEDNELTLALKSLGASMESPSECLVTTELMPTWRNLWRQRQRWQRGALENLAEYGFTRATLRYWGQQFGIAYGTVALNSALLLMLLTFLAVDTWIWFPFWSAVGAVFVVERVLTAWRTGWRGRTLAALLFPELAYDVFLQVVFVSCLIDISLGRQTRWGHVVRSGAGP